MREEWLRRADGLPVSRWVDIGGQPEQRSTIAQSTAPSPRPLSAMEVFVGVDVGTSSARAAVFTATGKTLARHVSPLKTNTPRDKFYEQSTEDVWAQVGSSEGQRQRDMAEDEQEKNSARERGREERQNNNNRTSPAVPGSPFHG